MSESFPIDNPPIPLTPATGANRSLRARENSALAEAIAYVCEARVGERGSRLIELLDKIEEKDGPKAAFDSIMKLMEFRVPKLQRVTIEDPEGKAPALPVINVSFAGGGTIKVVDVEPQDG